MPLFALKRISTGDTLRVKAFAGTPPVLSPAKDMRWEAFVQPPPTPGQIADAAELAEQAARKAAILADGRIQAIASRTPAQAKAWVDANITNLAQAKELLGDMAAIHTYTLRRL